jgi:ankyrin repeat protein
VKVNQNQTEANEIIDKCIDYLNKTFVDLNEQRDHGFTVLHWSSYLGFSSTAKKLLENNADINIKDSSGNAPLARAILKDKTETANVLLDHNPDPNILNTHLGGSLFYAALKGFTDICERLLVLGAYVD